MCNAEQVVILSFELCLYFEGIYKDAQSVPKGEKDGIFDKNGRADKKIRKADCG